MAKVKKGILIFALTLFAIVTLKYFSAPIKIAAVTLVTYISHVSASGIATALAIAFNALQIVGFLLDRWKARQPINDNKAK